MDSNAFVEATRYDPQSGRIIGLRGGLLRDVESEGCPFVLGSGDGTTHYVDVNAEPPALLPRPRMPVVQSAKQIPADGVTYVKLSGIPRGAEVFIAGESCVVGDGELEWASLLPGRFPITISLFPWLDWKGEVSVVAGPV